jgi:hypothetical protein
MRCGTYYGVSSAWAGSSKWRTIISMPREVIVELAAAAQSLAERSHDGKITAAAFRDRIGTGRKLAIQIPNRDDFLRGRPAETPGGPTGDIKRRR